MGYIMISPAGLVTLRTSDHRNVFTWTYSVFDTVAGEPITPSMYDFMVDYVTGELTKNEIEYTPGQFEEEAVYEYYSLPIKDRIRMHKEKLWELDRSQKHYAERQRDAIDALLDDNKPWDHTSSIDREYTKFMTGLANDAYKQVQELERQLHEEQGWYGGHEENLPPPLFDTSDEV